MNHTIRAGRCQSQTIWSKCQATDFRFVFLEDMETLAGLGIPKMDRISRIGARQNAAVRTKGQSGNLVCVAIQ